jgi:hypothetical protein
MTSNFKLFIAEKKERDNSISRVISAIEKRMPSLLNSKVYRFGGSNGTEAIKSGVGYLYFFGKDKAFRVRTKADSIVGFDIWKQYGPDAIADFSIDTTDLSVSAIAAELKMIAGIIKSPKAGKMEVKAVAESKSVSYDLELFEAKSVSPEDFLQIALKDMSPTDVQSVSFDQIVRIAKDNNVAVPNKKYLDGQKVGRGKWTLVPGEGSSSDGPEFKADAQKGSSADPILYIKVTAQDPVSKRFISAGDNKQAQALYSSIQKSMEGNPTKEELRDVDTLYGHLYQLVTLACKNKLKSLLIYGGPGTGKTYTIMKAIEEAGLVKGKDYVKLSGKATAIEIYKTLFMFREGGLVLFDDLDSMWKDKDAANFLKAALDTSPVREISAATGNMMNVSKMSDADREDYNNRFDKFLAGEGDDEPEDDEEDDEDGEKKSKKKAPKMKYPSTFNFKGRVVFISNLKKEEFDSAILSRSAKIDMSLTPEETIKRMRSILPDLGGDDVSVEDKEQLIEVLLNMRKSREIDQVTMREFTKGLDILRSGAPNWKDLIKYA